MSLLCGLMAEEGIADGECPWGGYWWEKTLCCREMPGRAFKRPEVTKPAQRLTVGKVCPGEGGLCLSEAAQDRPLAAAWNCPVRTVSHGALLGNSQHARRHLSLFWVTHNLWNVLACTWLIIFTLFFLPLMCKAFTDHLGILADTHQGLTVYQVLFIFYFNSIFTFYR